MFIGLNDQGATEKVVTQAYNARGRLAEFAVDEGGDGTVEAETEYLYDEVGLRVRQVLTENGVQQEVRDFIFDKQNATGYAQAVEELKDGQSDKAYTVGLDVIAQAVATAVGSLQAKDPAFFVYDGHGSVRQLAEKLGQIVKIAVDASGDPVMKAEYEAYGETINFAVADAVTTLLYSGEFTDHDSGMQYLRARWYDSSSGRFTRSDPFGGEASEPQSLHKYLYAHADPISFGDPSGLRAAAGGILALAALVVGGAMLLTGSALIGIGLQSQDPILTSYGYELALAGLAVAGAGLAAGVGITAVQLGVGGIVVGLFGAFGGFVGASIEDYLKAIGVQRAIDLIVLEHDNANRPMPRHATIVYSSTAELSQSFLSARRPRPPAYVSGDTVVFMTTIQRADGGVDVRWKRYEVDSSGTFYKPADAGVKTILFLRPRVGGETAFYDMRK